MIELTEIESLLKQEHIHFSELTRCEKEKVIAIRVDYKDILKTLTFFRDNSKIEAKVFTDIMGTDFPDRDFRFDVIYNLLSVSHNLRIYIKVAADEATIIPSAAGIFKGAIWFEREVWDMYGIMFGGNPDLRRILTDYGFQGHPLRKDFPLTGHVEVRYDVETKRVIYEPVNLPQEFRSFDFLSPWEGTEYVLPGDEKATKNG